MKKIFIALLLALPFTVMAQDLKIGIFNSQELMTMMPETNAMMSELETMKLDFSKQAETLQTEFLKKQEEFQVLPETTDVTIKEHKQRELARLYQNIEEFAVSAEQELMAPIATKIQQAIKKVGDENGFTYIIDNATGVAPYISPKADNVLPLIKKALNIQ